MAKWMNKMGLAAINFNIDDSKIAGFHKGFVDSVEGSPSATPTMSIRSTSHSNHQRSIPNSSAGDSENDSDKESMVSWQKSTSHHSSISDLDSSKDKVKLPGQSDRNGFVFCTNRIYLIMTNRLIYPPPLVKYGHHPHHC